MVPAPGSRKAGWRLGLPSFKLIRPCVFVFVYFCFGFSVLLSRACFWVPLRCIFIGSSFRFCVKLCLFAYFRLNYCVGLSYISIFSHFDIRLVFVLFYYISASVSFLRMCGILFQIVWICLDLCGLFCECVAYFSYFCPI